MKKFVRVNAPNGAGNRHYLQCRRENRPFIEVLIGGDCGCVWFDMPGDSRLDAMARRELRDLARTTGIDLGNVPKAAVKRHAEQVYDICSASFSRQPNPKTSRAKVNPVARLKRGLKADASS